MKTGMTEYMSILQSVATTEDMKKYGKVCDTYPDALTPSRSSISTPDRNYLQKETHNQRLAELESVPVARKLEFLAPEIAKEVEEQGKAATKQAVAIAPKSPEAKEEKATEADESKPCE